MGLAACQSTPPQSPAEWPEPTAHELSLQRGDVLDIRFIYWPELNEEQAIRPDGKIVLRLVGDVQAEGMTPEELCTQLVALYDTKLKDPEISVLVRSFDSHRVYVGGEVQGPGVVMIQGQLTALGAIMEAGGFIKSSAKPASVVLIRQRDGRQYARTINLRKSIASAQSDPVFLEPYDILFVPRTVIDRVDQFVDQYINKIIPQHVNFTFLYDFQETKVRNTNIETNVTNQ